MDVDELPIKYRVGRRNGHTIYLGGPDPHDTDLFIGSARSKGMAHTLVEAANVGLAHMNSSLPVDAYQALQNIRALLDAEPYPGEHQPQSGERV
jgi:hypothetical protein